MNLTNRQKIAHLLRRFGLGATERELAHLEPMGIEGALDHLLNFEKENEGFPVSPWEICREPGKTEIYLDGYRFAAWWALRLLMTQRPAEQKLTFFWHNHFAVSGEKVEFGPMLYGYLETLRTYGTGEFPALLKAVAKDPAMLRYLDGDTSVRNHPNENFARELMELFTLGKGNYTEHDIQEAARSLTGWGNRYLLYEVPAEDFQAKLQSCLTRNVPLVTSSFSPDLHDDRVKSVLGKQANYDTDSLLEMIAAKPQTAYFVTQKLWHFYASDEISSPVANRLAHRYIKTNGSIRDILFEIAKTDEFWDESCIRRRVKSPLDFVVPILRQFGLYPILAGMHGAIPSPDTPLAKPLRDASGIVLGPMAKQGMTLLFPPNVGGWDWGQSWITPNNMLARVQFADMILGVGEPEQPLAAFLAKQVTDSNPITSYNSVIKFLQIFDADLPPEKQFLLIQAFDKAGGLASLKTPSGASRSLSAVARLLFSAPEFQVC
ncbi:MAG: DUF1800 domain-containing protein [Fimbriimonas sp.]|nr:DUF1800 domain-containing protein [Fimbriimonas sp.]